MFGLLSARGKIIVKQVYCYTLLFTLKWECADVFWSSTHIVHSPSHMVELAEAFVSILKWGTTRCQLIHGKSMTSWRSHVFLLVFFFLLFVVVVFFFFGGGYLWGDVFFRTRNSLLKKTWDLCWCTGWMAPFTSWSISCWSCRWRILAPKATSFSVCKELRTTLAPSHPSQSSMLSKLDTHMDKSPRQVPTNWPSVLGGRRTAFNSKSHNAFKFFACQQIPHWPSLYPVGQL